MFDKLLRGLSPLLLLFATFAQAQTSTPVTPADLRPHVDRLASDEFQGRQPGTEGERLTINYIAEQFRLRGLEPAGDDGTWFQRVGLVERRTGSHRVSWRANGQMLEFDAGNIFLHGRNPRVQLTDIPVIFAGHGVRLPERGIDQLGGVDLGGALVLILAESPPGSGMPGFNQRVRDLTNAGAAAVVGVTRSGPQWNLIRNSQRPAPALSAHPFPIVRGIMPSSALEQLLASAGGPQFRLDTALDTSFRAILLPLRADFEVVTQVNSFISNNVVGRLRGTGRTDEHVVFLGHWDHFGICRPEGEADRICNGAVDNASGIAALIEIAGRLAATPRPVRDILFLATTAEEVGLLGAEFFATHPPVPARSIVAGINIDTIALHPAGEPVAVLGGGHSGVDATIVASVAAMGRRLDTDHDHDMLAQRHDGVALTRAGIPTVVVGGSFANIELLNAFLSGPYHGPDDETGPTLPLDGAAEDANLMIDLGRRLADPAQFPGTVAQ